MSLELKKTSLAEPWFGIRTRSNYERIAASVLEAKGYQPYVPYYRERKRWSDRIVETEVPLFRGYIFCRFSPHYTAPILKTPGVVSVISFGGTPAAIDDTEIDSVRKILESGFTVEPYPFIEQGQKVRVTKGVLEGLEGILVRKKSAWRMVVSVVMLQRSVSVELDREYIAAA